MLSATIAMVLLGVFRLELPLLEGGTMPARAALAAADRSVGMRYENPEYRDMVGFYDNGPQVGTVAPDFELQPLAFYDFGIDREETAEKNASDLYKPVRLSDFRGHKPVVLIFGSYT